MPKVTITFNLPEEREDYAIATNANSMYSFIWDFEQALRARYKHTEPPSEEARAEFEAIKELYYTLKLESNINLD